ncbi:MAG: hypothetical protein A2V77_19605 [Anaeromyxobacter sp. RBG_16_69_14]|nr:MAG: hypothetical protein A2V77_19605 [Anaeromyxobacter sp. RBG_16_69_14]
MKTLLSKLSDQLAPSDAPDAARGRARKAEAPGGAFRDLLGRALARSTGATHDLGRNKLHHVHTARAGAAKGDSERAIGENGAGAAEGAAFEEQGEQGQFEGTATSSRTGGSRSPRVPARKRREADGKDPVESANGSSPAGHIAAAPAGHAGHAATPAPPRSEKTALTGDGLARLASTLATRQPLATPSQAPAAASSREKARERSREHEDPRAAPAAARLDPPSAVASPQEASSTARAATSRAPSPIPPPPPGQDVQGAVLHHAAHLTVDAGALGSIELHLRLRDGALHLRVEGEAGRAVEARAGELSRTLAGEGLRLAIEAPSREGSALGNTGEGGRDFEERREAWSEAADARDRIPVAVPATKPTPTVTPGGVHVTA